MKNDDLHKAARISLNRIELDILDKSELVRSLEEDREPDGAGRLRLDEQRIRLQLLERDRQAVCDFLAGRLKLEASAARRRLSRIAAAVARLEKERRTVEAAIARSDRLKRLLGKDDD